ncbi:MAG: (2Fe-2S)-binding protein [Anaerolineae bacterium]|nr:(2Fe-2S)-binding protein [Anaerolineae bacterium]
MPTITLPDGLTIDAPHGKRLVLALEDGGVDILHRCGGNAKCTTCRVQFAAGEPTRMTIAERDRLADGGLIGQVRLSCQIPCEHDMVLKMTNRLAGSQYENAGDRPKDTITPEPIWVDRPR